jgi:hypothetical protein
MKNEVTIFWLAGESSGDLHCELVMKSLAKEGVRFKHIGIGGPRMQTQGLKPLYPFDRFAVMGFVEVIAHIGFFMQVERRIRKQFEENKPDLVILADYPGLTLGSLIWRTSIAYRFYTTSARNSGHGNMSVYLNSRQVCVMWHVSCHSKKIF